MTTHICHDLSDPEADAEAEAEAVSNGYHDRFPERPSPLGERLAQAACEGKLTRAMCEDAKIVRGSGGLRNIDGSMDRYAARDLFVSTASWALITVEYADRLAEIMRGKRVLEVGAGRGVLAAMMQARGIDWTATDAYPPKVKYPWQPPPPRKMDAMGAVLSIPFDVLVWSWWPYCDSTDYDMALLMNGRPIWIIGEGAHGCTGSGQFHGCSTGWDTAAGREPKSEWDDDYDPAVDKMLPRDWHTVCPRMGVDVPEWDGLHDHTYIALPEGRVLSDYFPL